HHWKLSRSIFRIKSLPSKCCPGFHPSIFVPQSGISRQESVKIMEGLIPICSYCKGIRNDQGYWSTVETFIEQHSDVEFTHGICNECMKVHFPDVAEVLLKENDEDKNNLVVDN
nr:hypothetical protein [Crocosphaera sp.]